jgi:hypothetical protein
MFLNFGHITDVFEDFCNDLRSETSDTDLLFAVDSLLAKMKEVLSNDIALRVAQEDADENGYLAVTEGGKSYAFGSGLLRPRDEEH